MAEENWGDFQRRWGSIVASYTIGQVKELIRLVVEAGDPLYTYMLLLTLKYRWDCPDPVFDLLEEIRALKKRQPSLEAIETWGRRACSVLLQVIGDEQRCEEFQRTPSNGIN
jgi:hypothetical protein